MRKLLFAGLALFWLGMSAAFAQGDSKGPMKPKDEHTVPIVALLREKPTSARDRRLYDLAVKLFKAIEAGTEARPTEEAHAVLARALHEAAQGNIPEAWIDYGRCLWNGWGVKQDREAALAAYKKAAALGSDYSAYLAAYNLYWTFERYDEAYAYARNAQRSDPNGEAHYLLGLMAFHGRGRPEDLKESVRLHQKAARLGNPDAMFELFVFSLRGIGDRETAVVFLKEAAKHEHARAMANLGVLHATGDLGFRKDPAEAVKWYRRAADKGHAQATATLGLMALRGEGMPKDPQAANAFFKRAEELGFDVESYLRKVGIERP